MCWQTIKQLLGGKSDALDGAGRKILVIDDGQVERSFMTQTLEKVGYQVVARPDGASGVEAALTYNPDLIILDYLMPKMDGNEVCRRIKTTPQLKNIPVIFLTGSTRPETVITCYDVGAEHYLSKPIDAKTLLKHVRATLDDPASLAKS